MTRFTLRRLIPLLSALLSVTGAHAGMVEVSGYNSGWDSSANGLEVPSFDPRLGILREVRIIYSTGIYSELRLYNSSLQDFDFVFDLGGRVGMLGPLANDHTVMLTDIPAHIDALSDFLTRMEFSWSGDKVLTDSLDLYSGATPWRIPMTSSPIRAARTLDGSALQVGGLFQFSTRLTATYIYDERVDIPASQLPEPASIALAATALGCGGLFRRLRSSAQSR